MSDTQTPAPRRINYQLLAHYVAAFALGGSMLVLAVMHLIPVDEYVSMIVTPGLAALGIYGISRKS